MELLDAEAEYYIDSATSKLFFIPPAGVDPSAPPEQGAFLSQSLHAHSMDGASHITLESLRLEYLCYSGNIIHHHHHPPIYSVYGSIYDTCTL